MVYQLRDDILDLIATDNQLGKPAGQDLAEGIYNLPTLFALRDTSVGDELRGLLGRPLTTSDRERARKLVVATDGIDRTIRRGATLPRQAPTSPSTSARAKTCAPALARSSPLSCTTSRDSWLRRFR